MWDSSSFLCTFPVGTGSGLPCGGGVLACPLHAGFALSNGVLESIIPAEPQMGLSWRFLVPASLPAPRRGVISGASNPLATDSRVLDPGSPIKVRGNSSPEHPRHRPSATTQRLTTESHSVLGVGLAHSIIAATDGPSTAKNLCPILSEHPDCPNGSVLLAKI